MSVSREVTWLQGSPYNLEVLGSRPGTREVELYERVIQFNLVQSCGSTIDSMVRSMTQWPNTHTELITEAIFKTMLLSFFFLKGYALA